MWDDVLDAPPPRVEREHHEGAFVLRHGYDEQADSDLRVGFATVLEARDADVAVEERVVVEPRVLAPMIRAERVVSRQLERTGAASVRIVHATTSVVSRHMPDRPRAVVERGGGFLAYALNWVTTTIRDGLRGIVEAPDRLYAGADSAGAHLRSRGERKVFLRGLVDPHRLTAEGKAAALVLALGGLVAIGALISTFIFLFQPEWTLQWRALMLFFLLGLGSTLVFPFFPELALFETIRTVADPANPAPGIALSIVTISLSMTIGGWLVLFLGDSINHALRKSVSAGSPVARFLDWAEGIARRRGFWVAFLVLAIPYGPDTPVFYILASVRTPTGKYLAGVLLGTLLRFTLVWGVPAAWSLYF